MKKVTKEFPNEHYLENDVVVEIEFPSGEVIITSYVKNCGRRRFERVKMTGVQAIGLKLMLNENF